MTNLLVSVGDVVVDRYSETERYLGGAAANLAICAARMGVHTRLVAAVGPELAGIAQDQLRKVPQLDAWLTEVKGPTATIDVKLLRGERKFDHFEPGVMGALTSSLEAPALSGSEWIVAPLLRGLGGVASKACDLLTGQRLAMLISDHSLPVSFQGREFTDFADLCSAAGRVANLVVVGSAVAALSDFVEISASVPKCVFAITFGNSGAFLCQGGETLAANRSFVKNPIDTNGCGDAFTAGVLSDQMLGGDWQSSLSQGVHAAQVVARKRGPNHLPALMHRDHTNG